MEIPKEVEPVKQKVVSQYFCPNSVCKYQVWSGSWKVHYWSGSGVWVLTGLALGVWRSGCSIGVGFKGSADDLVLSFGCFLTQLHSGDGTLGSS